MPSTYTLNNGIELIATGEQSGTWGDTTNTNMSLLDTALDGQVTVTLASAGTSGSPNTLPISDGSASDGRNRLVIFNDGADLGGTAYVQLTPNDAEKIVYIRNALSGSRSIIVFQGTYNASNDYEIPAGTTAVIFFNGGGTGAVAANVFNNAHFDALNIVGAAAIGTTLTVGTSLNIASSTTVDGVLDEDNMASDSATKLATQQSIKAYVDSQVTAQDLDFAGDSGTGAVDLDSQTFTISGTANEIETSASGQTLTVGLPDNVTIAGDLTVDTNTLFVDSSTNKVSIGTTSSDGTLHVHTGSAGVVTAAAAASNLVIENSGAVGLSLLFDDTSTNSYGVIYWGNETDGNADGRIEYFGSTYVNAADRQAMLFRSAAVERLRLQGAAVVINETGADTDFRVESDTNTHALFVDAGNTRVGIAESAPESQLHIKQTADIGTGNTMGLMIESGTSTQRWMLQSGRSGVSNNYFNLRDVSNSRDIFSVLDTDGKFQGHTPFEWNNAAVFNEGSQDYDFRVESAGNQNMLFVDASANAVAIGHDTPLVTFHVKTTGTGEVVRIESTNADASQGPILALYRNSPSPADNDGIGRINFLGEDSAGNQTTYNYINATITDVSNGTEDSKISMGVLAGGAARSAFILDGSTGAIFNEDGIAAGDFRVESDGATHMLFVDSANNRVGIGQSAPETPLQVSTSLAGTAVLIESSNAGASDGPTLNLWRNSSSPVNGDGLGSLVFQGENSTGGRTMFAQIRVEASDIAATSEDGLMSIRTTINGADTARLNFKSSEAVFNESGADIDFRVEGDTNANLFLVDASQDSVLIGTNSQSAKVLTVAGGTNSDGMSQFYLSTPTNYPVLYVKQRGEGGNSNDPQGLLIDIAGHNDALGKLIKTNVINSNVNGGIAFEPYTLWNDGAFQYRLGGVINENGQSSTRADFRVEGDSQDHALFVDASTNRVGIHQSSPSYPLDVNGAIHSATNVIIGNSSSSPGTLTLNDNSTTAYTLGFTGTGTRAFEMQGSASSGAYGLTMTNLGTGAFNLSVDGVLTVGESTSPFSNDALVIRGQQDGTAIKFEAGGTHRFDLDCNGTGTDNLSFNNTDSTKMLTIYRVGEVVVNQDAQTTIDFRVESSSNEYAFWVDASGSTVGINTSNTNARLNMENTDGTPNFYLNKNRSQVGFYGPASSGTAAKTVTITFETHSLDAVVFTLHASGFYYNNGNNTYFRETEFRLMREGTASVRINNRTDVALLGSQTGVVGVPVCSYASGLWTCTFTLDAGYSVYVWAEMKGHGTNKFSSVSWADT